MKIRGVWAELFRADRTILQANGDAISRFSQFCEHA